MDLSGLLKFVLPKKAVCTVWGKHREDHCDVLCTCGASLYTLLTPVWPSVHRCLHVFVQSGQMRRPAIQITGCIFNHMIKYTYFASSLKLTVLYFGFARFTAVSLLKTTKKYRKTERYMHSLQYCMYFPHLPPDKYNCTEKCA